MIDNVDISEWEKEHYTGSEISDMRRKDIEKAKVVLQQNKIKSIMTFLVIDGDTRPNLHT